MLNDIFWILHYHHWWLCNSTKNIFQICLLILSYCWYFNYFQSIQFNTNCCNDYLFRWHFLLYLPFFTIALDFQSFHDWSVATLTLKVFDTVNTSVSKSTPISSHTGCVSEHLVLNQDNGLGCGCSNTHTWPYPGGSCWTGLLLEPAQTLDTTQVQMRVMPGSTVGVLFPLTGTREGTAASTSSVQNIWAVSAASQAPQCQVSRAWSVPPVVPPSSFWPCLQFPGWQQVLKLSVTGPFTWLLPIVCQQESCLFILCNIPRIYPACCFLVYDSEIHLFFRITGVCRHQRCDSTSLLPFTSALSVLITFWKVHTSLNSLESAPSLDVVVWSTRLLCWGPCDRRELPPPWAEAPQLKALLPSSSHTATRWRPPGFLVDRRLLEARLYRPLHFYIRPITQMPRVHAASLSNSVCRVKTKTF